MYDDLFFNKNIPQISLVCRTINLGIHYKGPHSNAYNIVLNLKQLYSLGIIHYFQHFCKSSTESMLGGGINPDVHFQKC